MFFLIQWKKCKAKCRAIPGINTTQTVRISQSSPRSMNSYKNRSSSQCFMERLLTTPDQSDYAPNLIVFDSICLLLTDQALSLILLSYHAQNIRYSKMAAVNNQQKQIILKLVSIQHRLSEINSRIKQIALQQNDSKDLMRKYREKVIVVPERNFPIKIHAKEVYPYLEGRVHGLGIQKKQLEKQLTELIKIVIQMLKKNEVAGGQLEPEIKSIVEKYLDENIDQEDD